MINVGISLIKCNKLDSVYMNENLAFINFEFTLIIL